MRAHAALLALSVGAGCAHASPASPVEQPAAPSVDAQRWVRQGRARARVGDVFGARAAWETARALDPSDARLAAAWGAFELAQGNEAGGLLLLAQAARLRPDPINTRRFAHALADARQHERASEQFAQLFEADAPSLADATRMVRVELALDRPDEARRWARRAVAMDAGSARARVALGTSIAAAGGDASSVDAAFERALDLAPRDPSVFSRWAGALWARGSREEALDRLGRGLSEFPTSTRLRIEHVHMLAAAGRCAEASTEQSQLQGDSPDAASSSQAAVDRCLPPPLRHEFKGVEISDPQARAMGSRPARGLGGAVQ